MIPRLLPLLAMLSLAALAEDRRVPVIVELFTSEGCSSCPPADQLLSRLEKTQPVAGVQVIALEEHVDYWDALGWKDPFSSAQYRLRQSEYGHKFFTENIYTPQMVVNGNAEFVGNDGNRALQELERTAQFESTRVELKTTPNPRGADQVDLTVELINPKTGKVHNASVYLAVTERDLSSNVKRGENGGRLLQHAPVVRSFGVIGKIDSKSSGAITNTLRLPPEWKRENLRAVVFVQERDSSKIVGAAIAELR